MQPHRDPVSVITGASSGIGAELARVFARHGHRLVLVARRGDRLSELADDITRAGAPRPLVLAIDLERADAGDRRGAGAEPGRAAVRGQ
jgi:short-subunit dehydrogenase